MLHLLPAALVQLKGLRILVVVRRPSDCQTSFSYSNALDAETG